MSYYNTSGGFGLNISTYNITFLYYIVLNVEILSLLIKQKHLRKISTHENKWQFKLPDFLLFSSVCHEKGWKLCVENLCLNLLKRRYHHLPSLCFCSCKLFKTPVKHTWCLFSWVRINFWQPREISYWTPSWNLWLHRTLNWCKHVRF